MILSTSSSRAVSIRIGTSELLRIAAADLDAVHVGQVEVEDDQRRHARRRPAFSAALPVPTALHVVAGVLQVERDERGDRGLVLDDEDRLRLRPSRRRSLQAARCGGLAQLERGSLVGQRLAAAESARSDAAPSSEYVPSVERVAVEDAVALADGRRSRCPSLRHGSGTAADDRGSGCSRPCRRSSPVWWPRGTPFTTGRPLVVRRRGRRPSSLPRSSRPIDAAVARAGDRCRAHPRSRACRRRSARRRAPRGPRQRAQQKCKRQRAWVTQYRYDAWVQVRRP